MYHFNELYGDTSSKSIEQIERYARIVHIFSVPFDKSGKGHPYQIAFIVSKSRGLGDLRAVKKQLSTGNEIQQSLVTAKQNFEALIKTMHSSSKVVLDAKRRVGELKYMNSLLDSCFKWWH